MIIINESRKFTFKLDGHTFDAYVRYYADGDCDVELADDHDCPEAYEIAWALAEEKGLI